MGDVGVRRTTIAFSAGGLRSCVSAARKTGLEAEDESRGRRCIRRRKTHQKVEDASGAEAESETERHKGIPLTITPPPEKHRLNASLSNPLEHTLYAS